MKKNSGDLPLTFESAPDVLRMAEACSLLRRDRTTVTRMIHDGIIPALQTGKGGYYLIPKEGLRAALLGEGRAE